jgi:hypothetical protein
MNQDNANREQLAEPFAGGFEWHLIYEARHPGKEGRLPGESGLSEPSEKMRKNPRGP